MFLIYTFNVRPRQVHQPSQGRKGGAALQKNLLGGALHSALLSLRFPVQPQARMGEINTQGTGTALSTPPTQKTCFYHGLDNDEDHTLINHQDMINRLQRTPTVG
jgi:hypothetical protein